MLRARRAAVRPPRLPPAYLVPTPARPAAASAAEGRENSAPHAVLQQNGDPSARKASETARPGAEPGGNWLERAWPERRGQKGEGRRPEVWVEVGVVFDDVGVARWSGRGTVLWAWLRV